MTVGVNPWVIHRNQDVFGEDVEEFRPDRWLQEDTGNLSKPASEISLQGRKVD